MQFRNNDTELERRNYMKDLRALLYPRCFLKKKTGSFISLFFKELIVIVPSEADKEKKDAAYFHDFFLELHTILAGATGGVGPDELERGVRALTRWGEQLGLGQSVNFETFYSALSSSQDSEVSSVMQAFKGEKKEDKFLAAMAFLALSAEADKREDELELELEKVENRAKRISELVEEESILPEKRESFYYIQPLNRARERMRAWARVALSERDLPNAYPLGESIAVKDLMDAAFESLSGGKPVLDVFTFYIPLDEDIRRDRAMISKARAIFSEMLEALGDTCNHSPYKPSGEFLELSNALSATLDSNRWEKAQGPRIVLSIYPGFSWRQIMLAAANMEGEEGIGATGVSDSFCGSFFIV